MAPGSPTRSMAKLRTKNAALVCTRSFARALPNDGDCFADRRNVRLQVKLLLGADTLNFLLLSILMLCAFPLAHCEAALRASRLPGLVGRGRRPAR